MKSRHDAFDTSNLLLLEATPKGIVARPLKERLERSSAKSILLLQLCSPGEKRNLSDDNGDDRNQTLSVQRTRQHMERELKLFRDRWTELSKDKGYQWIHSTVGLGGALSYGFGMHSYAQGPVSPSAYLVLMALQQGAAAPNINERENFEIKVEDYLRDYRYQESNAIRLRPGWRFLAPLALLEK